MRQRRTKAETAQLEYQIMEVLEEDHPQSVRHVFYRMTDPRLTTPVTKTEQGYKQVQQRISKMRRRGDLPYGWISDATRRGYHVSTYENANDFMEKMTATYRADLWTDNDNYVEVWCESRSLAGVIQKTCEEYAVSLYPAGGFSSMTLNHDAAQYINHLCADEDSPLATLWNLGLKDEAVKEWGGEVPAQWLSGRQANIIYVGDYDPAGVIIDVSIEKDLREHLHPTVPLNFQRLAITQEQIEEYDLPTKPRKDGDRRARHIRETVEAEAMPAKEMRRMLTEAIEWYLPSDALAKVKVAEESEKQALDLVAHAMDQRQAMDTALDFWGGP